MVRIAKAGAGFAVGSQAIVEFRYQMIRMARRSAPRGAHWRAAGFSLRGDFARRRLQLAREIAARLVRLKATAGGSLAVRHPC
jgi:hypothetical protein